MSARSTHPAIWASFDDAVVGNKFQTVGRTVTEADFLMANALIGAFHQPIHTDIEWVRANTDFAERLFPGPMTLCYAIGLLSGTQVYRDITIAFLGLDKVRARAPIHPGDTITVHARIDAKRVTSNPSRGVIEFDIDVKNQRAETVMDFAYSLLVRVDKVSAP